MRRIQTIGSDHPLRHFFADIVRRRFDADMRLSDPRIAAYITGLLLDFNPH
jgi:hypothetical protein